MTPLRERLIRTIQLRRFSQHTQDAYVRAVAALAQHYHRSPDQLTAGQVQEYIHYLLTERRFSWSTVNVHSSAIRFFYGVTLGRSDISAAIPPRKTPRKLPEIFSREEILRLFECAHNRKHRTIMMTAYSAGLRVSEIVNLIPEDIDSDRMMIRVRDGKGEKDRYTVLSPRLLTELRRYWVTYRPQTWLFPGMIPGRPLTTASVARFFQDARQAAGIKKAGGIHTLRHCFATHLLESGVDISTLQQLLGHASISSTVLYLHLTAKLLEPARNPLDLLEVPERWPQ
jgi:integrase/recombinase XerD